MIATDYKPKSKIWIHTVIGKWITNISYGRIPGYCVEEMMKLIDHLLLNFIV